jgi:hypothetical protein
MGFVLLFRNALVRFKFQVIRSSSLSRCSSFSDTFVRDYRAESSIGFNIRTISRKRGLHDSKSRKWLVCLVLAMLVTTTADWILMLRSQLFQLDRLGPGVAPNVGIDIVDLGHAGLWVERFNV